MLHSTASPASEPTSTPFAEQLAAGVNGPSYFAVAMAIVMDSFERLDTRRRDRFADRLRRWAIANPPPRTARQANDASTPGDRFVAVLTVVARRAVRPVAGDAQDAQSLFGEGLHMGLQRLVKYWGPGRRYPQRCPVHYAIQAVKSGCSNAVRKHVREQGKSAGWSQDVPELEAYATAAGEVAGRACRYA